MDQVAPHTIYLIRHPQSEENALGMHERISARDFNDVLRRSPAAQLTPVGQQQAMALVAKLRGMAIGKIYSSPFVRALATARVLGEACGVEPEVVESLREVLPRLRDERRSAHSLGSMFIRSYLELFVPWGEGESWPVAYRRAQAAWRTVSSAPVGEVAVVAHHALISLIVLSLRRDPVWRVRNRDVSNGGISVVERRAT